GMSRRWRPSEGPGQAVTALAAMNRRAASQLAVSGAPTMPAAVMAEIHNDLLAFQRTTPSTALVSTASIIRGERKVLSDRRSASSTGSTRVSRAAALANIVMARSLQLLTTL